MCYLVEKDIEDMLEQIRIYEKKIKELKYIINTYDS